MARFSDLPKDVAWIVIGNVFLDNYKSFIINFLTTSDFKRLLSVYEGPNTIPNNSFHTKMFEVPKVAMLNKKAYLLIKSKTALFKGGWMFNQGALSSLLPNGKF